MPSLLSNITTMAQFMCRLDVPSSIVYKYTKKLGLSTSWQTKLKTANDQIKLTGNKIAFMSTTDISAIFAHLTLTRWPRYTKLIAMLN